MNVVVVGNPNSGKTTLYNLLSGENETIGNWSGVTVNKKTGFIKDSFIDDDIIINIVDLPGTYSIAPYTSEEKLTFEYLNNENIDVIINVLDATNLSRGLFLTTQLLSLGIPVCVVLNKSDLLEKSAKSIGVSALKKTLGCEIFSMTAETASKDEAKRLIKTLMQVKNHTVKITDADLTDKQRYDYVESIVSRVEQKKDTGDFVELQDKFDRVLTNKWLALPIFVAIMTVVFLTSQSWVGPYFAKLLTGLIDKFYIFAQSLIGTGVNPVISSILLDGIIGGVGAVLGFIPLIMVLFFCLALLEDCGYMARVAVIMDRYLKKIGLSGKSIIPIVLGTGCSVPAIMTTRTIKNERQRRTTAVITPFMPCGAKLPIIALFSSVLFSSKGLIGVLVYFMGLMVIVISGLLIKKINGKDTQNFFIMELPTYKKPSLKKALFTMLDKSKSFIIKAGTVILICNVVVHILQSFDFSLNSVGPELIDQSILATLGGYIAIVLIPLGFGAWQFAAASITGFIAKENVVGTLAVCFSITNFFDGAQAVTGTGSILGIMGITPSAALALMMFNLFTPPCFAAISAMKAELNSNSWFFGAIGFQLSVGYILAFIVYQVGTLVTERSFGDGFIYGLLFVVLFAAFFIYKANKINKKVV